MNKRLRSYGFSQDVVKIVSPISEAIEQNRIEDAEERLFDLCIDVCDRIEKGILSPKEADKYFTLIDLYITDHHSTVRLKKEAEEIVFEGMLLHDYGKEYGASLDRMKFLAIEGRKYLKKMEIP
jgi:hypothetical protein